MNIISLFLKSVNVWSIEKKNTVHQNSADFPGDAVCGPGHHWGDFTINSHYPVSAPGSRMLFPEFRPFLPLVDLQQMVWNVSSRLQGEERNPVESKDHDDRNDVVFYPDLYTLFRSDNLGKNTFNYDCHCRHHSYHPDQDKTIKSYPSVCLFYTDHLGSFYPANLAGRRIVRFLILSKKRLRNHFTHIVRKYLFPFLVSRSTPWMSLS